MNLKSIFSGSRDYSVKGWDIETGQCITEFSSPRNIVTVMEFSPTNENILFQGSEDLCIRVWDTRESSRQPAMHLTGYIYFPLCMDIHNNSNIIATGCKGFNSVGCEVKFWDIRNPSQFLFECKGHTQDVTGCKFNKSSECNTFVSVSKDGSIFALNTNNIISFSNQLFIDNNNSNNNNDNNQNSILDKKISPYNIGKSISCIDNIQSSPHSNEESYALGASDGSILFLSLNNKKLENDHIGINDKMEFHIDYCAPEYFSNE